MSSTVYWDARENERNTWSDNKDKPTLLTGVKNLTTGKPCISQASIDMVHDDDGDGIINFRQSIGLSFTI